MLRNEGDRLRRVIVCSPRTEYFFSGDLAEHNLMAPAEPERAMTQHAALRQTMEAYGVEVVDVPELLGDPNSVFTRDAALCTPKGYIQLRMGLPTRRREPVWLAEALTRLGEPKAGEIIEPGTVEGGDVILAGDVAFVGCSRRTNDDGANQIKTLLEGMGYEVRLCRVPDRYLHLGGKMGLFGPRHVLCCRGEFPRGFFAGFEVIEVCSASFICGNVICLGENEVIAEASNEEGIALLRAKGVIVHDLALSEFVKGTGGPSCLIMPVERDR